MKFLIDNNLSPVLENLLISEGFDAIHVGSLKLSAASDQEIFLMAFNENRIIISSDTDFGYILSNWKHSLPSVILFRQLSTSPSVQILYLKQVFQKFESELSKGCILVVEPGKVR